MNTYPKNNRGIIIIIIIIINVIIIIIIIIIVIIIIIIIIIINIYTPTHTPDWILLKSKALWVISASRFYNESRYLGMTENLIVKAFVVAEIQSLRARA